MSCRCGRRGDCRLGDEQRSVFQRPRNSQQTALEHRLATADTPATKHALDQDVVDRLARLAIDEAELDRAGRDVAVSPAAIHGLDTSIAAPDPHTPDHSFPDGGDR